jgi:hypothetical protein
LTFVPVGPGTNRSPIAWNADQESLRESMARGSRPAARMRAALLKSAKAQRIGANLSPECQPSTDIQASHILLHPVHRQPLSPNLVRWTF